MRLITPQIPSPAPRAITSVCKTPTAELKNAIKYETKIADLLYFVHFYFFRRNPKSKRAVFRSEITVLFTLRFWYLLPFIHLNFLDPVTVPYSVVSLTVSSYSRRPDHPHIVSFLSKEPFPLRKTALYDLHLHFYGTNRIFVGRCP